MILFMCHFLNCWAFYKPPNRVSSLGSSYATVIAIDEFCISYESVLPRQPFVYQWNSDYLRTPELKELEVTQASLNPIHWSLLQYPWQENTHLASSESGIQDMNKVSSQPATCKGEWWEPNLIQLIVSDIYCPKYSLTHLIFSIIL